MDSTAPSGFTKVEGLPVLGSLTPVSRDALSFFTAQLQEHGDRVQLRVPGRSVLLLGHPDDIEQVLKLSSAH